MTVFDLLGLLNPTQEVLILDYEQVDEDHDKTMMYRGLCWKCPYSDKANKDCTISKTEVDLIEAEADILVIGINYDS